MATTETGTLTFLVSPGVKEALCGAAKQDHRFIANTVQVLIRDYCGRNRIMVRAQQSLFLDDDNLQPPTR